MSGAVSEGAAQLLPAVRYLRIDADGGAHLEGRRCVSCKAVFLEPRPACARCFSREPMEIFRLAERGCVYNSTIVYRNFPGVKVPFISVIVDMDGGGVVRGNLLDVEPDPNGLPYGRRVRLTYRDAGRKDADGNAYLAYFFLLDEEEGAAQ